MSLTTKQILEKALRRIKRHWCQGTYSKKLKNGERAYCAIGAVNYERFTDAHARAIMLLRSTLGDGNLASWNDSRSRKKSDVIELYKKAIANCK